MLRASEKLTDVPHLRLSGNADKPVLYPIALFVVVLLYVLAAMIRLAYFNVMEEQRQKVEEGTRKTYLGLPVTSAALIFPTVMLIQFMTRQDLTLLYFGVMLVTAIMFVVRIHVPKPQMRGILIMIGIGLVEFILLAILLRYIRH